MSPLQLNLWKSEKEYLPFKKARRFCRKLKLRFASDWDNYIRGSLSGLSPIPDNIPKNPDVIYNLAGWKDWEDWLGLPKKKSIRSQHGSGLWDQPESIWIPFEKAREIVRSYGFEYQEEWEQFVAGNYKDKKPLPANIPGNPDKIYKHHGWNGWNDWLIDPQYQKNYSPFYEAREFVRSLRLRRIEEWTKYIGQENPLHLRYDLLIPAKPHLEYKNKGWIDWDNWFGSNVSFKDYKTTQKFIHGRNLKSVSDWKKFCRGELIRTGKKAENIYAYPEIAYKGKGWTGWDNWLGISLFEKTRNKVINELPDGAKSCRCEGRLKNCEICDGKGYYYPYK